MLHQPCLIGMEVDEMGLIELEQGGTMARETLQLLVTDSLA